MPDGVRTIPLWFWCGMDEMMKNRPNVRSKLQSRPEQRQPGIFVRCGVREGAVLTLGSRERIRIGREVPCELVMPSQKISRIHCTVEFDEEQKNLSIHYPANGIMIDIKNNNSDGIVVYNNFYITEKLKKQAAEGKIRLELLKNSIEEEEKARINN